MPHDLMLQCEENKRFVRDGKVVRVWTETLVAKLTGAPGNGVRCMHCHGGVRVHKQQAPTGPADHVEHRLRQDSEHCKGGAYFKGTHSRSTRPVE